MKEKQLNFNLAKGTMVSLVKEPNWGYEGRLWTVKEYKDNKIILLLDDGFVETEENPNNVKVCDCARYYLLNAVVQGLNYKIDFEKRNLSVNGVNIIKEGVSLLELDVDKMSVKEIMDHIEQLYIEYKYSIPSEKTSNNPSKYFKALPEEELEDEDMLYGEPRAYARARLEVTVLLHILAGNLVWNEEFFGNKWFYQGQKDKDFIFLKKWITAN